MSRKDPDGPFSFEEEMARMGVTRLDGARTKTGAAKSPDPRTSPPVTARPARPDPPSAAGKPARAPAGTSADPVAPPPGLQSTPPAQAEALAAASAQLAALSQTLAQVQAELAQARQALARADAARLAQKQAHSGWERERTRMAERERALRAELDSARQVTDAQRSLRTVLGERGLLTIDEMTQALAALLANRPEELLAAIELSSSQPMAMLLEQRVALVAADVDATLLDQGCALVRVPPERCEISGGSDLRAAFRRFIDSCQRAGVHAVTIVGGSIAYRKQLKELATAKPGGLRLNLVSGTQRRTRRQADADMRNSDIVVIWGATELNHSVSSVYRGDSARLLRIPHRGISGMLDELAAAVALQRRSRQ